MKTQSALLTIAVAIFVLPATALAQDDAAAQINSLIDSHQEKLAAFSKKARALPRDEQAKLYQSEYPDASEAIASITEIIKANPNDDASLEGITWILRSSRGSGIDKEIYTILEEHHLNNEKLVDVAGSMMRIPTPEARAFLKLASEKSEVKNVRGVAIYARAIGIERDVSKADEYTALIETLIKDYPDAEIRGRNLAKSAEGKLFAAKNLGIGKQAPEIIGKDVDGNEMKLSDYRGKIVVIDFWGDW